jgi:hypothetical protein
VPNKTISSTTIFLLIISLGALFVRLYGLNEYAFNDDELWHLVVSDQNTLWDVIQYNFKEEVHPPLSYIIWHYMLKISHNDLWLRMSGIIPGILLIPSIYLFGRLYIGRAAGYCLAFIFAFGAMPVSISTTIRAYTLMMLALTWAAIFAHKYRFEIEAKLRKKYLILYSLCALAAIELNHAALFTLATLGLILIFQTLKEKNKRDFVIISVIHLILAGLVGLYAWVLKVWFGFGGNNGMFFIAEPIFYLINYVVFFLWFPIGSEVKDWVSETVTLISFLSLAVVPIVLIRNKRWSLLNLIFTPLVAVMITNHFRIYPFSIAARSNLFLFFSVAISYAYFIQISVNFLSEFCKNEKFLSRKKALFFLQISATSIAVIFTTKYVVLHNVFRNTFPSCSEFNVTKSDLAFVSEKIKQKNTPDNVFVTLVKNVWYWRLQDGDKNHVTILTDHLGKFENSEITIYFTAFPAREASVTADLSSYQTFFKDLYAHLNSIENLAKVKSFTIFDVGSKIDYLTRRFTPEPITPKEMISILANPLEYKRWQRDSNLTWALHNSDQVLEKFHLKDKNFACGREVMMFSFTPKFVRDEILSK